MINAVSSFSGFSVDDIEAAREFYEGTLQLELTDDQMGLGFNLPGGGRLFIYEKEDHEPATYTVLNFVVEDINDTIDHLTNDHGITMERYDDMPGEQDERGVMRGKEAGMGPDIAWFTDPAGNVLAVVED
jgi:predicted enzyme related to lactoylglutathione lyase